MFGNPATKTSAPLFGTSTTSSSTPLFGAPATSSSAPLFGTSATSTSAPSNSLFGSSSTLTTSSSAPTGSGLFGAAQTTNNNNSLFGQPSTSTATPLQTNSLFGSLTSTNNSTQQQQQQQQQQQKYLDLETCFPDTKVPHFVVTPNSVTRTSVPANFFLSSKTKDDTISSFSDTKSELKLREPLSSSFVTNERNSTLPNYLTSYDGVNSTTSNNKSTINNVSSKKRVFEQEDTKDKERSVISKTEHGVFTRKDTNTSGFYKNLNRQGNQLPPTASLRDVGIPSSVYSTTTHDISSNNTNQYQSLYTTSPLGNSPSIGSELKTRVRVFGYNQDNIEKIIQHFTSIGELSEPYISQGNWITFNYTSPELAKKAINCNGMNIDQDHLIGVTWDERAQEVEHLQYQPLKESSDLFTNNTGFMNLFYNNNSMNDKLKKQQENNSIIEKLKEKWLGW